MSASPSAPFHSLVQQLLVLRKDERDEEMDAMDQDSEVLGKLRELFQDREQLRRYLERMQGAVDEETKTRVLAETQSGDSRSEGPRSIPCPDFIGPYRILEILGHGGMGVVYLAEQSEPVQRRLALKLVHRNLRDPVSVARFEAERQAMARLSHPNIAQIYEAGTTEDGFPYFAMEFVSGGRTIIEYCDAEKLTIEERLRLFLAVCRGVQHAHQRGIIHRDLKPSNILVTRQQGEVLAMVIDFGLAKALDQPLTGDSQLTLGNVVGTPEFMSPESFQIDGAPGDLDTRSDVYTLGIILYEMLCGRRPYQTQGMNLLTLMHHVVAHDPPTPSQRFSNCPDGDQLQTAEDRRSSSSQLRRRLTSDLEFVVMKAIATDREARYSSVSEMATDIERYLQQEPIEAHPPSRAYRVRKFVRRHRTTVLSFALAVLALFLGTIGTTVGMIKAHRETEIARQALDEAEELATFLEDLFRTSEPGHPARDLTSRELLDAGAALVTGGFEDQPEAKARILATIGDIYVHLALHDEAEVLLAESLELRKRSVGTQHPTYGQVLSRLGALRTMQDRFRESETLLVEALEIFRAHGMPAQSVETLSALARSVRGSGDYDQAEILFRKSLDLCLQNFEADSPQCLESLNGLGSLLLRQDRLEEAESITSRALEIAEKSFGPTAPRLIAPLRILASIYRDQGRWSNSLLLLERALTIAEEAYGSRHPQVARLVSELAEHYEREDQDRAIAAYRRATTIFEEVYGRDSMDLAVLLNNFGSFYWSQGRYEEAEPLYRKSLEIKESLLEPGHIRLAHSVNNLGLIYWKRGRFEPAESLLRRALEMWEQQLGPEHSLVAWPLWGLAGVYRDQGRFEEAEALYQRALEIRERLLPANDPDLQDTRADYAQLLRATGRVDRATQLESEAG